MHRNNGPNGSTNVARNNSVLVLAAPNRYDRGFNGAPPIGNFANNNAADSIGQDDPATSSSNGT